MSQPPQPQSAQDFCLEVKEKKTALGTYLDYLKETSPIYLIGKALGKFGSSAEANSTIKNNITNVVNSSVITSAENRCANAGVVNQSNTVDNTECVRILGCGEPLEYALGLQKLGYSLEKIDEHLQKRDSLCSSVLGRAGGIVQTNALTSTQNCALDGVLEVLSQAKLDSGLTAIFEKAQESKGLMSSTSSDTNSCNVISNTVDSETYTSTLQACNNTLGLNQGNLATCSGGAVTQGNRADLLSQCLSSQGVAVTQGVESKATVDVKESVTVKATGLDAGFLLMMAACGVVLLLIIKKLKG